MASLLALTMYMDTPGAHPTNFKGGGDVLKKPRSHTQEQIQKILVGRGGNFELG